LTTQIQTFDRDLLIEDNTLESQIKADQSEIFALMAEIKLLSEQLANKETTIATIKTVLAGDSGTA
jgi:wobble nucleotide-excising tRNase